MMQEGGQGKVVWYVVFCDSDSDHWLFRLFKLGHVYAVRSSYGQTMWGIVNPMTNGVDFSMMPKEVMTNPQDYNDKAFEVVRCVFDSNKTKPFKIRAAILNCVTLVKCVLGIDKGFIVTPKHLRRYLLKEYNGATVWRRFTT